ncbi:extracellular solute-binding protein [Brachybacterium sp. UMB0905]|uniref:extracellular solute-binding protein n=1 Tax=Brachybacterium sp. UMB0905 TaxID=2069310 RepID=UPI0013044B59|nr:extracellular solute-binding protein [Brachybacterium sp. UMB0905]
MTTPTPRPSHSPRRRTVIGGAAVAAVLPALAACGGGDPSEKAKEDVAASEEVELPTYSEQQAVEPDYPSVNGSTPGYTTYPQERPVTVEEPPGSGGTFTLMTPTWSAVQSNLSNDFTKGLNEALGATLEYQMTTGNDYRDKQAAVFASPNDVADWVAVFGWNPPPRFSQAVESVFQDLTPFLSGDNISRWPNLANLPTPAWEFGIFNGKLYGIPVPGEIVTDAIFHRADIFDSLGLEAPQTAEEFLEVCRELTDPGANRWATNDMNVGAPNLLFGAPPDWRVDDGKLVYRWETPEYREALEFQVKLFEEGLVHPDVAADTGDAKQRFESGQVAIHYDGVGAWGEAMKRVQASNPEYRQAPLSGTSAGGREPIRYKGSAANFFSFLKKSDDQSRIEELLGIANYLAAPFGTAEWEQVNFGTEGVHFKRGKDGVPEPTEALGEQHPGVLSTLVTGPVSKSDFTDAEHVKQYCEWMAGETEYMVEGPFYGRQVPRPPEYAALDQPMYDLEKDVARGRKSMDDFDQAVEKWRKDGGDKMREYYQGVLDEIEQ